MRRGNNPSTRRKKNTYTNYHFQLPPSLPQRKGHMDQTRTLIPPPLSIPPHSSSPRRNLPPLGRAKSIAMAPKLIPIPLVLLAKKPLGGGWRGSKVFRDFAPATCIKRPAHPDAYTVCVLVLIQPILRANARASDSILLLCI